MYWHSLFSLTFFLVIAVGIHSSFSTAWDSCVCRDIEHSYSRFKQKIFGSWLLWNRLLCVACYLVLTNVPSYFNLTDYCMLNEVAIFEPLLHNLYLMIDMLNSCWNGWLHQTNLILSDSLSCMDWKKTDNMIFLHILD